MCTGYERGLKIYYKEKEKINEKRKKYVAIMCAALLAFSSLLQGCGKTETESKNSTKEVLSESSDNKAQNRTR